MFQIFYYLQHIDSIGGAFAALVALAGFAFSLWMAFDCWKRNGDGYWIWLILCTGGVFALIYFFTQYWQGSSIEYGLWKRFAMMGTIRDLENRSRQLNTAASHEILGDAYLSVGKNAEAEKAYRAALQRQPDIFDVQVRLGYALLALNRAEEAWPFLGKAYQQKPDYDNDQLIWKLARCQAKRGNFADARNLYEYFLKKHSYSEVQIEYAALLLQMGEREESRAKLQELIADIEFSPRYARSRERRWTRAAKKLLRTIDQPAG
jgi:hypothetical protein